MALSATGPAVLEINARARRSRAGALHFRLLDDERNSFAGAGAIELFDSRAAPPAGAESIHRASEMTEEPRTHTVVSMSVVEYTAQVRLPPSPSETTLVVRQFATNAFFVASPFDQNPWLVAATSTECARPICSRSSTTHPTGTNWVESWCLCSPCGSPSRCCVQV